MFVVFPQSFITVYSKCELFTTRKYIENDGNYDPEITTTLSLFADLKDRIFSDLECSLQKGSLLFVRLLKHFMV